MATTKEFRTVGKEMVDYICDYIDTIEKRPPLSQVSPGYLQKLIPKEAPKKPELWEDIKTDIERVIMPGVSSFWLIEFILKFENMYNYSHISISRGIWGSPGLVSKVIVSFTTKMIYQDKNFLLWSLFDKENFQGKYLPLVKLLHICLSIRVVSLEHWKT